jgi:CBS domain-containing protein
MVRRLEPDELRIFAKRLLRDIRALDQMLSRGLVQSGRRRVGCEQEMFLVDRAWRPFPSAIEVLDLLDDHHFTTELGRFNLEANLDPQLFEGDCLSRMEADLADKLVAARNVVQGLGGDLLLTGILPTLRMSDLSLENLTPKPRYLALNDAMSQLRGGDYEFRLRGTDELIVKHDSVMLEACCTSFQIHYQADPEGFVQLYNAAQALTAPLLAGAVNSPMLFGRRLWLETRIPLFQQAIDTRQATASLRERSARVSFGERWLEDSVIELFREDLARFRILLGVAVEEDSLTVLNEGRIPSLRALQVHNGTIYRWNRACYGVDGATPHLRIENRVLPAGPTVLDEVANASFFFGRLKAVPDAYPDLKSVMDFEDAHLNFLLAAQTGLKSRFRWIRGKTVSAQELILKELLPIAREGLRSAKINESDVAKYLGVIEARVSAGRTGAQWILKSFADTRQLGRDAALTAVTAATAVRQWDGEAGYRWTPAGLEEGMTPEPEKLRIEESMTTDLFTIHPEEPIDMVANLMDWKKIRHVPVEDDGGCLVGLVSSGAVLQYLNAGGKEEGKPPPAGSIMDRDPVTIPPETSVQDAIVLMGERRAECLLVVKESRLVGIVTERDVLRLAAHLLGARESEAGKDDDSSRSPSDR